MCNLPKLLEKQLKDIREQCIDSNIDKESLKGYDYAVETVLKLTKQIIDASEEFGGTFVHSGRVKNECALEEFDLHGLLELLECRVVAQNK